MLQVFDKNVMRTRKNLVAAKTASASAVDNPIQRSGLELSNLSLPEDRETHLLALHLTKYGERRDHTYTADCCRYTVRLNDLFN